MRVLKALSPVVFSGAALIGAASKSEAALIYTFEATVTRSYYATICFSGPLCADVHGYSPLAPASGGYVASMPVGSVHAGRLVVPTTPESYEEFDLIECRLGRLTCGGPSALYIDRGPDFYGFRWTERTFGINFAGLSASYFNDNVGMGGDSVYPSYWYFSNYIDFSISNVAVVDTDSAPVPLPPSGLALLAAALPLVWRGCRARGLPA